MTTRTLPARLQFSSRDHSTLESRVLILSSSVNSSPPQPALGLPLVLVTIKVSHLLFFSDFCAWREFLVRVCTKSYSVLAFTSHPGFQSILPFIIVPNAPAVPAFIDWLLSIVTFWCYCWHMCLLLLLGFSMGIFFFLHLMAFLSLPLHSLGQNKMQWQRQQC